ncbi:uncharacterized protein ACA1_011380, partial [Acanthamoeba castellanii str. Neff]
VIDKDASGTISLAEWKATDWGNLLKNIKTPHEGPGTQALTTGHRNGVWQVRTTGGSELAGEITIKDATTITGKLGYHPLTNLSLISGSRIFLHGQVPDDAFPRGAECHLWLDAIHNTTDASSELPYMFTGYAAQKLGNGMPLVFMGKITATFSSFPSYV